MKLDKNGVELLIQAVENYSHESVLTNGQKLFNALSTISPALSDSVVLTTADPFYLDENIEEFLVTILNEEALQIWYGHPISQIYK
jgi:hypothetical protein